MVSRPAQVSGPAGVSRRAIEAQPKRRIAAGSVDDLGHYIERYAVRDARGLDYGTSGRPASERG